MIVLFNPLSTTPGKQPLPLSVLSLAAVLEGRDDVDARRRQRRRRSGRGRDRRAAVARDRRRELALLAVTVMPGPQLTQAVAGLPRGAQRRCRTCRSSGAAISRRSTPTRCCESPFVDFVVRSQGERPLLQLARRAAIGGGPLGRRSAACRGRRRDGPHRAQPGAAADAARRPAGSAVRTASTMAHYIHPTYLGRRTVAHNSSFGCPFACSFCAVVAMTNRRWLAQSPGAHGARRSRQLVRRLPASTPCRCTTWTSSSPRRGRRSSPSASRRSASRWWALGRIDTLMQYSDATWRDDGALGAEDGVLGRRVGVRRRARGDEQGRQGVGARWRSSWRARMRDYGVVPEFSFVLGSPPDPLGDLAQTFEFIRTIKRVNPRPRSSSTPTRRCRWTARCTPRRRGSASRFRRRSRNGRRDEWRQLMMRRGDGIPWIDGTVRRRVRNFERVLNAFYPTVTDSPAHRRAPRAAQGGQRLAVRAASTRRRTSCARCTA